MSKHEVLRSMPGHVGRELYEVIGATYPAAGCRLGTWLGVFYVALGWRRSHDGANLLVIPFALLAAFENALTPRVLARETYPEGAALLRDVQEIVGLDPDGRPRVEFSEAVPGVRSRAVTRASWPDDVAAAIEDELQAGVCPGEERVNIFSGRRTSARRLRTAAREANRAAADNRLAGCRPQGRAGEVLDVLGATPSNALARRVRENMDAAIGAARCRLGQDLALARRLDAEAAARRRFDHDARTLRQVAEVPEVRYVTSTDSPRLFVAGGGLGALTSHVRRTLLSGFVEVDLHAAQLGCLVALLDLPLLKEATRSEADLWVGIAEALGLDTSGATWRRAKAAIKPQGVYAACYGRPRGQIVYRLGRALGSALDDDDAGRDKARAFVQIGWIDELLGVRDQKLVQIEGDGGVHLHDGRFIALHGGAGDHVLSEKATARTALAYAASALELDVLGAVTDLQADEGGRRFQVQLWQHDGASLRIVDASRTGPVLRDITTAVDARAAALGVPTRLVAVPETLPTSQE